MAAIANRNGLICEASDWLNSKVTGPFDAVLYLYAFCALPDSRSRLEALKKIRSLLRDEAPLYLDVLNINDVHEWGPKLVAEFDRLKLSEAGYDLGDLLYSKIGDSRLAYWHYFSESELHSLLKEAGFSRFKTTYIGYGFRSGETVGPSEGAIFVEARR